MSISLEKLKVLKVKVDKYIMYEVLQNVYEVVVELGQLFLLMGEFGMGKILLVVKVVYELSQCKDVNFYFEVLEFNIKIIFMVRDFFYVYDVIFYF